MNLRRGKKDKFKYISANEQMENTGIQKKDGTNDKYRKWNVTTRHNDEQRVLVTLGLKCAPEKPFYLSPRLSIPTKICIPQG